MWMVVPDLLRGLFYALGFTALVMAGFADLPGEGGELLMSAPASASVIQSLP